MLFFGVYFFLHLRRLIVLFQWEVFCLLQDVCIEIAKKLDIAPVALDFFTLMTTDCEHCLRPNRQVQQHCDKQNDHYLNPKRVLHAEEIASKVFFFRLAFKAVAGPDLKAVNSEAYEYFVMQV